MTAPRSFELHPRAQELWFWQALIGIAAFALPSAIVVLFVFGWLASLAVLLFAGFLYSLTRRYLRRYGAAFRCELSADGLLVQRGVWWQSTTFIPRSRIQHTEVGQGPIARHFGIASLKVYTAGTHLGELAVDGLAHADAVALRDLLLGRAGRDGL
jgi:membrane protein YdbS with pleckstrin-like domain